MSTILTKKEQRSEVAKKLMDVFAGFKVELGEKKFEKNVRKASKNLIEGLKHADEEVEKKETGKKPVVRKTIKTAKPKKAVKKAAVKKVAKKSPVKKAVAKTPK
jgi:DNA-binding transcriptional regulator YbjK